MTINNLVKNAIGTTLVGAGALMVAGTAYAGPKEDVSSIRDYVRAHPTITGIQGNADLYGLRAGNILVKTAGSATWFELTGKDKVYFLCDNDTNGKLDGLESADASSKADQNFAEMDCLSADGEGIPSKRQESYQKGILPKFKKIFGLQ